jgi:hypothetical protein
VALSCSQLVFPSARLKDPAIGKLSLEQKLLATLFLHEVLVTWMRAFNPTPHEVFSYLTLCVEKVWGNMYRPASGGWVGLDSNLSHFHL